MSKWFTVFITVVFIALVVLLFWAMFLVYTLPAEASEVDVGYDYYVTPNPHLNTHEDGWGIHARWVGEEEFAWLLEFGHLTDIGYQSGSDYIGELRGYNVLFGLMFRPETDWALKPYLFGGVGPGWWDWKESSFLQGEGITIETDVSFVSKVGGGFEWVISDRWSVSVESGWFQSKVPVECRDDGVPCRLPDDDPTGVEFIPISVEARYQF